MTRILFVITDNNEFAVIDNHKKSRKTYYDFIFKTKDYRHFVRYIKEKGLN